MPDSIHRTSTAAQLLGNRLNFDQMQSVLNKKTKESSSGGKLTIRDAAQPGRVFDAQALTKQIQNVRTDNNISKGYLDRQYAIVEQIRTLVTPFIGRLNTLVTPDGREDIALQNQAGELLQQIEGLLNQKNGEVFLFGKDATDVPPVAHLSSTPSHTNGQVDTSYYQGGSQNAQTILDPNAPSVQQAVSLGANVIAIERTVATLALARDGHVSEAKSIGQQAVTQLGLLKGELQGSRDSIEAVDQVLESLENDVQTSYDEQMGSAIENIIGDMEATNYLQQAQLISFMLAQSNQRLLTQMMNV